MMGIQEILSFSELIVLLLLTHHASFLQTPTSNSAHLQKEPCWVNSKAH